MPLTYDAVVVGAGPAGSVAAMVLASAGRSVALVEKQRLPRYKTCGGGVVARALTALPCAAPTEEDIPMRRERRIVVHHAAAAPMVVERDEPPLTLVMRADFDRFLADRAVEAGVDRIEGQRFEDLQRRRGRYRCRVGGREVEAAAVVGADGAESGVARFLPGSSAGVRLGVALEGELVPGRHAAIPEGMRGETRFDLGSVPAGYGWVFPKNGHLSVGVFSRRPRVAELRSLYRRYVGERGLAGDRVTEERLTGHRIPVKPRRVRGHEGVLLAGDAAGLADPLTGEGISFAIRSGRMAAQAILRAGADPRRAASEYEAQLVDLLREIRTAWRVASLLYRVPGPAFGMFARHPSFASAVVEVFLGRRTYPELLRRALRRPWRLL